jgi:nucleotide-binding universal stress UspA family protein
MSVKTVAVPLIPGPSERSAIETAFTMARGFDGHVVGLHAALKPGRTKEIVMSRAGLGFSGDRLRGLHAEEKERTAREADQARRDFFAVAEVMQAKTVDHPPAPSGLSASFKALTAVGSEVMAVYCRVFDLVVVGQPKTDPEHVQRQVLRAMLFTSGRPVLMAPEDPPESVGEVVLIGWNGSALSARAAAISRQHVRRARKVGIVTARTESAQGPSACDLAEYLAWHGIDATIVEVDVGRRLLGDVLLEAAGDFGADLLVMGAYAHTPFRESLTRGVTNHILSHAHLPVLMAH